MSRKSIDPKHTGQVLKSQEDGVPSGVGVGPAHIETVGEWLERMPTTSLKYRLLEIHTRRGTLGKPVSEVFFAPVDGQQVPRQAEGGTA